MLMILINGLIAGPAVSLYGSPTVSPVTAALCASDPLPPKLPSSMYFMALSHAPPPVVMEIATKMPVMMVPSSTPPSALGPRIRPTSTGTSTGSSDGTRIIGLGRTRHDAGDFLELAAHFDHHRTGCAADRFHAHCTEQIGRHAADEQPDDAHV